MYPYDLFRNFTLYDLLLALGIISAVLVFRYFSDRDKVSVKFYNFILYNAIATVILGYLLSVVTQAVYNWLGGAEFEISGSTGATFLGGLVGGAAVFLIIYFGVGHFVFRDGENISMFPWMSDTAAVCIPAAHALGRLGCLMAGCCYGKVFSEPAFYTFRFIRLDADDNLIGYFYALPVQLYESLFLMLLALTLGIMKKKMKGNLLSVYMISYGVWRFFIEYIRGDERGETIVSFLSPSQLTSLLLIAGGAALYFFYKYKMQKKPEKADA